jgi:hypothetical protein
MSKAHFIILKRLYGLTQLQISVGLSGRNIAVLYASKPLDTIADEVTALLTLLCADRLGAGLTTRS